MTTAKPTGTCPVCGRMDLTLTAAQRIPRHGDRSGCPGAGQSPATNPTRMEY